MNQELKMHRCELGRPSVKENILMANFQLQNLSLAVARFALDENVCKERGMSHVYLMKMSGHTRA